MLNMATFCLNIFKIGHLLNLSSYEIGHKPPAISNFQLEGDDLTHPALSGVNRRQISRTLLLTERTICCISIMPITV